MREHETNQKYQMCFKKSIKFVFRRKRSTWCDRVYQAFAAPCWRPHHLGTPCPNVSCWKGKAVNSDPEGCLERSPRNSSKQNQWELALLGSGRPAAGGAAIWARFNQIKSAVCFSARLVVTEGSASCPNSSVLAWSQVLPWHYLWLNLYEELVFILCILTPRWLFWVQI